MAVGKAERRSMYNKSYYTIKVLQSFSEWKRQSEQLFSNLLPHIVGHYRNPIIIALYYILLCRRSKAQLLPCNNWSLWDSELNLFGLVQIDISKSINLLLAFLTPTELVQIPTALSRYLDSRSTRQVTNLRAR